MIRFRNLLTLPTAAALILATASAPGQIPVSKAYLLDVRKKQTLSDIGSGDKTKQEFVEDLQDLAGNALKVTFWVEENLDRHALIVDPTNRMLYEFYQMRKTDIGWIASGAAIFDLKSNKLPDGWTSADAAGLPIFPATVRYDEIRRGRVEHAMRMGVSKTRRAYVYPATHYASRDSDPDLPRMGERLRLKKDFDIRGFSAAAQAILKGLKLYGVFVADNGLDWTISVARDSRIPLLHEEFSRIKGSAFEVVERDPGR